jgi:hypothetical protein
VVKREVAHLPQQHTFKPTHNIFGPIHSFMICIRGLFKLVLKFGGRYSLPLKLEGAFGNSIRDIVHQAYQEIVFACTGLHLLLYLRQGVLLILALNPFEAPLKCCQPAAQNTLPASPAAPPRC